MDVNELTCTIGNRVNLSIVLTPQANIQILDLRLWNAVYKQLYPITTYWWCVIFVFPLF